MGKILNKNMQWLLLFSSLFLILGACTRTPPQVYISIDPMQVPVTTNTPVPFSATATATLRPTQTLLPPPSPLPSLTVIPTPTPRFPYIFPIQPPRNVQFNPGGHAYPATDIFAVAGTKYVAVTDGIVEYISAEDLWSPSNDLENLRGGISVGILGVDGLRYYGSHLMRLEDGILPGVIVRAGQVLGYVGSTGNARGKDAHVHFGVSFPESPNRAGEIDPYPCLVKWKENIRCVPQP